MSAVRKGAMLEGYACDCLAQRGYVCATAGKRIKRLPDGRLLPAGNDFFDAFDVVATHASRPTLWVQVSVISERSRKRKQVEPALAHLSLEHNDAEVWSWIGGRRPHGQRFRVQRWNGVEWSDAEDAVLPVEHKKARAA